MAALRRSTLREQIMQAVLDMISAQNIKKDEMLPTEKEIAEKLGVGRNSVREAMKAFNAVKITESIPGKGTFLRANPDSFDGSLTSILDAVSGVSLMELIEVRRIVETEAAELAALQANQNPEGLAELKKNLDSLLLALENGKENVPDEGFNFHMSIVNMCGNRLLGKLLQPIIRDIRNSREILPIDTGNVYLEENIHVRIYNAIADGNPKEAKAAMIAHFSNTTAYYRSKMLEAKQNLGKNT